MGNLVGMATHEQVEEYALREAEILSENEKLKDEVKAHQDRFNLFMDKNFAESVKQVIEQKELEDGTRTGNSK
jgi:hypothetical protein